MANCSKETTLPNLSTTEGKDMKQEIIAPFYLQDKAKRSQDLQPFLSLGVLRFKALN